MQALDNLDRIASGRNGWLLGPDVLGWHIKGHCKQKMKLQHSRTKVKNKQVFWVCASQLALCWKHHITALWRAAAVTGWRGHQEVWISPKGPGQWGGLGLSSASEAVKLQDQVIAGPACCLGSTTSFSALKWKCYWLLSCDLRKAFLGTYLWIAADIWAIVCSLN
jgi:hypothetical protein